MLRTNKLVFLFINAITVLSWGNLEDYF